MSSCVFSLLEVIERELPGSLYTNLGDEQVVLLLNMPEKEKLYFRQNAEQMVLSIKEAMPSNISEKLFAYGGNEVDRLDQIYDSFHNAAYMFNNESGQDVYKRQNQGLSASCRRRTGLSGFPIRKTAVLRRNRGRSWPICPWTAAASGAGRKKKKKSGWTQDICG